MRVIEFPKAIRDVIKGEDLSLEINDYSENLATQNELIEQIITALEEKSSSSSGGSSVETCTVDVTTIEKDITIHFTQYINGSIIPASLALAIEETVTIENVIKGSTMFACVLNNYGNISQSFDYCVYDVMGTGITKLNDYGGIIVVQVGTTGDKHCSCDFLWERNATWM